MSLLTGSVSSCKYDPIENKENMLVEMQYTYNYIESNVC